MGKVTRLGHAKLDFRTTTVLQSVKKKLNKEKGLYLGIGINELVRSRRSPALSVLDGEAYCVVPARHYGAAWRFLLHFTKQ